MNVFKYKINLVHPFLITAKPKSFDPGMQKKMKQEIQDLLKKGIIRLLYLFLLLKDVKSLYFTYSIVNFTALNLQGITSLHLLTTRVGLLSLLKSVRLFLQTTGVA